MNEEGLRERRAYLAAQADKAFKNHVLTVEGEGRWHCAKPGTSIYSFRVITAPGCLLVYGDIKEAVFRISDRDVLPWLRGSIDSLDYVLGKVTAHEEGKAKSFLRGEALRELEQLQKDNPARADAYARVRKTYDQEREYLGDDRAYVEAMREHGFEVEEVPSDWDSQLLWQYHALRTFCRLLDAIEKERAA